MSDIINEIKSRISIEDLVSQYVKLKKVGHSFKGLCPFHSEKTPSFIVSPEKQIAYCFGCNKGGDIFKFIQEIEGVDFSEALKLLAEKAGVKVEHSSDKIRSDKVKMFELYEAITSFYEDYLWNSDDGKKVLNYVRKRGVSDEFIKKFRIGFAPDSFEKSLLWLLQKGFDRKLIISSGMAIVKDTTMKKIYDRFRGRLMFPIFDYSNRVIAFGGRAVATGQEPKYLNSPDSMIYRKSNVLYGYNFAKKKIKEDGDVVIVEGYMDVIMAVQTGEENVVATCGTSLTAGQIRIMKPFLKSVSLCFDMDDAGRQAVVRGYDVVKEFDLPVYVISLPVGKDVADFVKENSSVSDVFNDKVFYGDFLFNRLIKLNGVDSFSAKKNIIVEFAPFLNGLNSAVEKDSYIRKLASSFGVSETQIYDEFRNLKVLPSYHPARLVEENRVVKKYGTGDILLGLILEYPRIGKLLFVKVKKEFFSEELLSIYNVIASKYNRHDSNSDSVVDDEFPQELREKVILLSLYVSEHYGEISEEIVENEINILVEKLEKDVFNRNLQILKRQLIDAEKEGDSVLMQELIVKINNLYSSK